MKTLSQYINEYLIKKKVNKVRGGYKYHPQTKKDLQDNIKELLDKGETDLNCIDTSEITDMSELFNEVAFWDKTFDVSEWNVSNVENMNMMFSGCINFDCYLYNWNVSKVNNMQSMFGGCEKFEGKGIENWDVNKVEDMSAMFVRCYKLDCDLSNWNVSNVENMNSMFYNCKNFDCDLSNWDVSNVKDISNMFLDCEKFEGVGLDKWNINISKKSAKRFVFNGCKSLKNKPSWYEYKI